MIPVFTSKNILCYVKNSFKNNKATGPDGLGVKIFTFLPDVFVPFLLQFGTSMEKYGKLPLSMTRDRIALISRKGDGAQFGHWRPITVLNETYRILAGVISKQIELILN
uniref:NELlike 1 [Xenopus (Silurana) tropicalis] n=1 Tax=Lepeophtheirus salmonis TaxID=72036 RepID=A0A0K2UDW5_LEPSM